MPKYIDGGDIDLDKEVVLDSKGRRITEARAEQMAQEAIEYLDEKRGRKSLTGGRGKSPEVKARVPAELRDQLVKRAKLEGKKPSVVLREALEKHLKAS